MSIEGLTPAGRARIDAYLDGTDPHEETEAEPPQPAPADGEEWYRRRMAAVAALGGDAA